MPPQVLYFGAVGAVLAFIWLAQGGGAIDRAPGQHDTGEGGDRKRPGGGGAPPAGFDSPYSYNMNESPSPDGWNPSGGTTDNADTTSTSSGSVAPSGGVAGGGIAPLRGGIGVGGVSQPTAPVAAAITAATSGSPTGYSGGYVTYGPYVPQTASAGGGAGTSRL